MNEYTRGRKWKTIAVGAAALTLLGLAACGDDDDDAGSDEAAYCDTARQLDEQEDFPSEEQLQEYVDQAPDEIADDVEYIVDVLVDSGLEDDPEAAFGQAFSDPEFGDRLERVEEFEAEACGSDDDEESQEGVSTEIDPDAERVDVSATEYDFDFEAPSTGAVSFVMSNDGDEAHFMYIGRLLGDATLDEALESDDPQAEGLVEDLGESDVAAPGEEAVLTVDNLEPGNYAMACFIPAPDGTPHAFEGMAVEFTVE